MWVGSGTGPTTTAPVASTASTICRADWSSILWSKIKAQWALPEGILPKDNFVAVIAVKILRNGTIADLNFEKRSGNKYFDESAMKAIKKASPLPALPDWIKGSNIELGIIFHSSELK